MPFQTLPNTITAVHLTIMAEINIVIVNNRSELYDLPVQLNLLQIRRRFQLCWEMDYHLNSFDAICRQQEASDSRTERLV